MSVVSAQITHPKASPFSEIVQEVGLAKLSVAYSRPAVKGRKIFGELVPYGRIWRAGANESSKFTTSTELSIMGNKLPEGTYALYAFPAADRWEIVFHRNISHWGDGRKDYDPGEDAFRITLVPEKMSYLQENLLITFDRIDHNSANMQWVWEYTRITIPILVPTDRLMLEEIEKRINVNPNAQTYYEAARYFQEQGTEYVRALEYLNKAIALGGDTYYFYRVKSLVEAGLGNFEAAVNSAKKSLILAQQEDKDEFVRMNKKNIALWTGTLKDKQH